MKKSNPSASFQSWAQFFVLTASLTLQAMPIQAFADASPPEITAGPGGGGNPHPHPTPTQTSTPGPDLGAARSQGRSDAVSDGAREGAENGAVDGARDGEEEGRRTGFERCAREAARVAHDAGFQRGFSDGQNEGARDGNINGDRDGTTRGINEGQADGLRRADRDANNAASPAGQARGISEANASDASARGQSDGRAAGDKDAYDQAQTNDYPRGREDYRQARINEPTVGDDQIVQKAPPAAPVTQGAPASRGSLIKNPGQLSSLQDLHGGGGSRPTFRYLQIKHHYPTSEENNAYSDGAHSGYEDGFQGAYRSARDQAYRRVFDDAARRGCEEARHRDYTGDYAQGQREGHDQGYREAYDRNYSSASSTAYNRNFGPSSAQAYQANYNALYNKHFEDARAAAYAARVTDLYNASFQPAHDSQFAQAYPEYQKSEYKRGQNDEANDFAARPIRLLSVEATETIQNGVFEPGEALRLHLQVRNFASNALRGQDVGVQIEALDANSSVVTISRENLVANLNAKSLAEIREALEFRLNESAAGRVVRFNVKLLYQGKVVDSQELQVRPNFVAQLSLAETPQLKEGIAVPLKVKVSNSSQKPAQNVVVQFKTDPKMLQVDLPVIAVGTLAAGETKIVEFSVIARDVPDTQAVPLAFVATEGGSVSGRRIGLLNLSEQLPVINDYRIDLANSSVAALRTPGVVRLPYTIKNISRRITFQSLEVRVSFVGTEDPQNFVVIGPNPQYLLPMDSAETASFVIPVLVKAANTGGVVQVEVREAGQTVVIHREDFSGGTKAN